MKKFIIYAAAAALALVLTAPVSAAGADAVVGTYLVSKRDTKIKIYKWKGKYYGKIVWMRTPKNADGSWKKDTKNPSKARRSRKILGLNLVWGFVYSGGKWSGGKIYNPRNGKVYKCTLTLSGRTLKVRGYIGYGWASVGETKYWRKL